jgi:hypothetical protein
MQIGNVVNDHHGSRSSAEILDRNEHSPLLSSSVQEMGAETLR